MHIITTITMFTAGVLTIINNVTTACQRLSTTGGISCSAGSGNPSTSPPPSLVNSFTHHHCLGIFVLILPIFCLFQLAHVGSYWSGIYYVGIKELEYTFALYPEYAVSQEGTTRRVYLNEVISQPVMIPTQLKQLVMGVRHSLMVSRLD